VGKISEKLNHHPKIINEYNKVNLELWTHDKNEITDLDHKLAAEIDDLI
jgi:4a-hydroxytetrahydrobiopterin dehydratase